jgi:hypothetical protein
MWGTVSTDYLKIQTWFAGLYIGKVSELLAQLVKKSSHIITPHTAKLINM